MSDFDRLDPEMSERPEHIEHQIEQTRERMTRDIDAIGDKLRPSNLAHEAMDSVSAGARRTGGRVADFVRENPLPVMAVGIAATWLIMQRSKSEISGDRMARYAYTGPERRTADRGLTARLGHAAERAKETIGDAASSVADRASELGSDAKSRAANMTSRMRDLGAETRNRMADNPFPVAVGALILGLAAGLLLPETRREDEMMGTARDRLADRAGNVASRVADVAADAASDVKETLKNELTERGPEVKAMAQDVARRVTDDVKGAAEQIKEQVKEF